MYKGPAKPCGCSGGKTQQATFANKRAKPVSTVFCS